MYMRTAAAMSSTRIITKAVVNLGWRLKKLTVLRAERLLAIYYASFAPCADAGRSAGRTAAGQKNY